MFRAGTRAQRPFAASAAVSHRCCSQPLQRAVTDFGADVSFAQAAEKLREHYGVDLAAETIRGIVEGHAQALLAQQQAEQPAWPAVPGVAQLVAEVDGGMVPIVVADTAQADRRVGKSLEWREAKLVLVHAPGSTELHYGGTLLGGVEGAGQALFNSACRAGFGGETQVHALGDGALWIGAQVDRCFGAQATYLVDFYHVSDYLGAAAKHCAPAPAAWLHAQQQHLRANRVETVLAALAPYAEPDETPEAPVNACWRYLDNRRHQLDYQGALARGLPIGSGEIESAHRYVVQQRLKRPGAWWTPQNAERMLALRLNRANRQWEQYWDQSTKHVA